MNNKGASMLYVLAALIVVGFIGTALLKMTHADRLTNVMYSSSAQARQCATSGQIFAQSYFQDKDNNAKILELLQAHIDAPTLSTVDPKYIYLNASGQTFDDIDANNTYRCRILGFDTSTFNVSLMAEGITKNGGRASSVSVFNLNGIGWDEEDDPIAPTNAIQMDGNDNFEFNINLYIDGDTYVGGRLAMNNLPPTFDGKFYMKGNSEETPFNNGAIFMDTTYIGGKTKFFSKISKFYSATGFENYMYNDNIAGTPQFLGTGDIFFNGGFFLPWGKKMDANGNNVHSFRQTYSNTQNTSEYAHSFFTDVGTPTPYPSDRIDIEDVLKFKEPPVIPFDTTVWHTVGIREMTTGQRITGKIMNDWYTEALASKDTLKGGFMVVRAPTSGSGPIGVSPADNTQFTGKVLFIMKNTNLSLINFYESSNSANSVLYLESGGTSTTYLSEVDNFRGIIYCASGGYSIKCKNTIVTGCLYYRNGAKNKYDNDGGAQSLRINYSDKVVEEASFMGIFNDPDADASTTTKLVMTNSGIVKMSLVSQSL